MAKSQKSFGGEMPVGVLVAEEHPHDRRDRKRVENPGLLDRRKFHAWKVTIDQRQPAAPDEEFQHHHHEQPEADRVNHSSVAAKLNGSQMAMQAKMPAHMWRRLK